MCPLAPGPPWKEDRVTIAPSSISELYLKFILFLVHLVTDGAGRLGAGEAGGVEGVPAGQHHHLLGGGDGVEWC